MAPKNSRIGYNFLYPAELRLASCYNTVMIKILESTAEEIKEFNGFEWKEADRIFYGENKVWKEQDFVFKAVEKGEIIGSAYGKFSAGVLYIDDLIIKKNKRGKGIGKKLMEKVLGWGKDMAAHKAYLVTKKEDNSMARSFYEKLGFLKKGEFKNHYHRFDFVIYEKSI